MEEYYTQLCLALLEEHFGSIIQCIGSNIVCGMKTLSAIFGASDLPLSKIKEGLCVLIKHGFVTYQEDQGTTEYELHLDKVIMLLRYPRFMVFTKTYCGDDGEIILEEVLKHGYITASEVIIKAYKRIEQSPSKFTQAPSVQNLKNKFEMLLNNRFLMRSISSETEATEKPDYNLPDLDLKAISSKLQGQDADPGDDKIYWKVNFDRFTEDFRDEIIISATSKRFDANAGELMRQMIILMDLRTLSWAATSNPIPYTEIKEKVRTLNCPELEQYLDQYLRFIEEDNIQFIRRVGDSGGGQYIIDMKNAFKELTWTTLGNIVSEKFSSKAARIFNLLRTRRNITQEQIQHLAMISIKETKFLLYGMAQENYIQSQEVKKITTSVYTKAPLRYYINLTKVVQMVFEHCCQALRNILKRREHESLCNKRMIEKQLRIQILSANMKEHGATEQQLADIEDMMTPSENEQLEKAKGAIQKLAAAELEIDETLFILSMYLRYH